MGCQRHNLISEPCGRSGKVHFSLLAPIALLTNEPVVTAKELAITKNIADTLRVILEIANSVFPKCSIATKNRNQGATLIKAWSILHTDRFRTLISNRPSYTGFNPYFTLSIFALV